METELLSDLGPIYTETELARFPVEPCNTISNLLFLAVAIYWMRKKSTIKDQNFRNYLNLGLPLLMIGYVGGTIYHATRSHVGWMLMDVVPIYLIAFITSIYHWYLIKYSIIQIIGIFIVMACIPLALLWSLVPSSSFTQTMGYVIIVIPVVLPILIDQFKTQWKLRNEFLIPFVLISVALCFRVMDSTPLVQEHFKIGTHWLWHTCGAMTCHFLLLYMTKRAEHRG